MTAAQVTWFIAFGWIFVTAMPWAVWFLIATGVAEYSGATKIIDPVEQSRGNQPRETDGLP